MTEYEVIDTRAAYDVAVGALAHGDGPVGVDVERASGFRYSQRAYLIQIFRRGSGVFLFDPPALGDLTALQEVLVPELWILHAASQDLPSLREAGLAPARIFDTELAARLLGHERVGLGAVVENTLGIALAKEHSAADWSTRPLPQSWLEYAALDVIHLPDVYDLLVEELTEKNKTEIARQEFESVLMRPDRPPREDPWRRLSGLHTVRGGRGLAIARALWTAREEFAREQDTAPGRLVPDRSLVAAIRANPKSKQELASLKEFNGRASRSQLDRWWTAIQAGQADPAPPPARAAGEGPPPPRAWRDRHPEAAARLAAARAAIEVVASELEMPVENLLTPDTLRRIAWEPPTPSTATTIAEALTALGARPWQIERTAQPIADAFVEALQVSEEPLDGDS